MTKQILIYDSLAAVSLEAHGTLSVRDEKSFAFARGAHHVPLMASEFALAAAEVPIVFAGPEGDRIPVALYGMRDGENTFVGPDGAWLGRYVPAFLRRYPFVFSTTDQQTFTLCVDETYPGCNREGRGERLFDADGAHTTYLKNVLAFLQAYQEQFTLTRAFCTMLDEAKLLEPAQARYTLASGEVLHVNGFSMVSRERLKALGDEKILAMARGDGMELVYTHLVSTQHFEALAARSPARG